MADKLAQIKIECLVNILEDMKDNGGQMLDKNDIIDHVMSFSQDLPDNSDFARLSAWIEDRVVVHIPYSIQAGYGVDFLLAGAKKELSSKKGFLASIFG